MAEAKKPAKTVKLKAESKETKENQLKHAELVAETSPAGAAPDIQIEVETVAAKAGKRSPKALKDSQKKAVKEARKAASAPQSDGPKSKTGLGRPKAERSGKKYKEAVKLIDKTRVYPLKEAMDLAVKSSAVNFDASVELHINLGVDPRQADQNIRDTVALPAGTGKKIRIAVLAEADDAAKAKSSGADFAGADEIFNKLDKEEIDFDVLIAVPAMMPKLGKYARLLGPRGLMPNPKSGTVSQDPAGAVKEAKAGRVEYRVDQSGIIHLSIGKASFGADKLSQNAEAVLASIRSAKPASIKGIYIKSIYACSTMGPSIKVEAGV